MAASTVVSDVMGKVIFVHKLPMIIKATSDDDTPTAGYLYQEIADLTYVSSNYCKSLLDVLVDRLDKSSHHVKFKVLRVMKFVVENGSEEFHSGLLRRPTKIQLATKFSGPPDPLHGNAPYIAVRTAAKELSEVLFDTEKSKINETSHKRTASAGGLGASRSGSSMEGFGNTEAPVHKQKSLGDTIKEGFRQLTDSFRESSTSSTRISVQSDYRPLRESELAASPSSSFLSSSGKQKPSFGAESFDRKGEYKPVVVNEAEATRVRSCQPSNRDVRRVTSAHKQGKPAGGWEDCSGGCGSNASNSDGQQSGDSTELSERLESVSVEDVSMETKLVEDFVSASDGKPTPSRDSLTQFVKRCSTLNCEKVTELLGLELQSASTPVQLRCLCVLEALMREDVASADHLSGFLPNTLTKLQSHTTDRLLQAKASKILRQLERTKEEAMAARSPKHQQDTTRSAITEPILDIQQTCISSNHQTTDMASPLTEIPNLQESLSQTSQKDKPMRTNPAGEALNVWDSSSQQVPKSLFSGMEVESAPKQDVRESQLDERLGRESGGDHIDKNVGVGTGQAQLLDDLLDLSSTDQPTLAPAVEINTLRNPRTNQPLSGDNPHSLLQQDSIKSVYGNESGSGVNLSTKDVASVQGTRPQTNNGITSALELVDSKQLENPRKPDSIMSCNANFNDLIATTGVTVPTGNSGKNNPSSVGELSPKRGHTQPVQSKTPVLNADQISVLYPQLAGVRLSGATAVPLKLGERPLDGNFAFVAKNGGKNSSMRASSFDFVKDAMTASKK